jgi:hypothetical protein
LSALVAEVEAIAAATGTGFAPFAALLLAGFRGAETEATPLIEGVITDSRAAGQGVGIQWSQWAAAVLHNGLGRYEAALDEAQQAPNSPASNPSPARRPRRLLKRSSANAGARSTVT